MNKLKNMLTTIYAKSISIGRVTIKEQPTDRAGKWKIDIACGGLNIEIVNLGLYYSVYGYVYTGGKMFYLRGLELFDNIDETVSSIKDFITEIS